MSTRRNGNRDDAESRVAAPWSIERSWGLGCETVAHAAADEITDSRTTSPKPNHRRLDPQYGSGRRSKEEGRGGGRGVYRRVLGRGSKGPGRIDTRGGLQTCHKEESEKRDEKRPTQQRQRQRTVNGKANKGSSRGAAKRCMNQALGAFDSYTRSCPSGKPKGYL